MISDIVAVGRTPLKRSISRQSDGRPTERHGPHTGPDHGPSGPRG